MLTITIRTDFIRISDGARELVYWDRQEWVEDPDLTTTIANAVFLASTDPAAFRAKLAGAVS